MALRDLPFSGLVNVVLIGDLRPAVIDAIPAAFGRLATEGRIPSTSSADRSGWDTRVRYAPAESTDSELVRAALRAGFEGPSANVLIAGSRIAVALPHERYDGSGTLELVHRLLEAACGETPPAAARTAHLPLLHALRAVRARDVLDWVRRRRQARPGGPGRTPLPAREPGLLHLVLTEADLRALKRRRGTVKGRATALTRVGGATVAALRAGYLGEDDIRIRVPVDLRHHVPGRTVRGNFVCGEPIGSLLGDGWDPALISARLAELAGGGGVVALAASALAAGVRRARAVVSRPSASEFFITISLVRSPRDFPSAAWTTAGPRLLACVSSGPAEQSVFAFAWLTGGDVHLSVWDSVGLFDLGRAESALRGPLAAV
jgi:hypothetical protein